MSDHRGHDRRRLPRNFRSDLHTYTVDQLAIAYDIAHGRALDADPASRSRTRWTNVASDIGKEVFRRGFRLQRSPAGGYSYERFREEAQVSSPAAAPAGSPSSADDREPEIPTQVGDDGQPASSVVEDRDETADEQLSMALGLTEVHCFTCPHTVEGTTTETAHDLMERHYADRHADDIAELAGAPTEPHLALARRPTRRLVAGLDGP